MKRESAPSTRGESKRCQWFGITQYTKRETSLRAIAGSQHSLERFVVCCALEKCGTFRGSVYHMKKETGC